MACVRRRAETAGVASLTLLLAAGAVLVAWVVFRLERAASRQRERGAAREVLLAVQRGIVEGLPDQGIPGWGEIYFSTIYDGREALRRSVATRAAVEQRNWDQVFVVPTAPLELLATTSGGGLISEETVFAANFALWRVMVFNQYVQQQGLFNALHAAEILDPATTEERLRTLGIAAGNLSEGLHLDGIGHANAEGGWYDRLKKAVASDIDRLGELSAERWWRYGGERHLLFGDVGVAAVFIVALLFVVVQALV